MLLDIEREGPRHYDSKCNKNIKKYHTSKYIVPMLLSSMQNMKSTDMQCLRSLILINEEDAIKLSTSKP